MYCLCLCFATDCLVANCKIWFFRFFPPIPGTNTTRLEITTTSPLADQKKDKIFSKKMPRRQQIYHPLVKQKHRQHSKNLGVMFQGCRFVPYTFAETIRHRWCLRIEILVSTGLALIQGRIYNSVFASRKGRFLNCNA